MSAGGRRTPDNPCHRTHTFVSFNRHWVYPSNGLDCMAAGEVHPRHSGVASIHRRGGSRCRCRQPAADEHRLARLTEPLVAPCRVGSAVAPQDRRGKPRLDGRVSGHPFLRAPGDAAIERECADDVGAGIALVLPEEREDTGGPGGQRRRHRRVNACRTPSRPAMRCRPDRRCARRRGRAGARRQRGWAPRTSVHNTCRWPRRSTVNPRPTEPLEWPPVLLT